MPEIFAFVNDREVDFVADNRFLYGFVEPHERFAATREAVVNGADWHLVQKDAGLFVGRTHDKYLFLGEADEFEVGAWLTI